MKTSLDGMGITDRKVAHRQAADQAFYNTSRFTRHDLRARHRRWQLRDDFVDYLDGFSPTVQDPRQLRVLQPDPAPGPGRRPGFADREAHSHDINLSLEPVRDTDGTVRHPGPRQPRHAVFEEAAPDRPRTEVDGMHRNRWNGIRRDQNCGRGRCFVAHYCP